MSSQTQMERLADRAGTRQFDMQRAAIAMAALWLLLVLFFGLFPEIDIELQRTFFREKPCLPPALPDAVCGMFPLAKSETFALLRETLMMIPYIVAVLVVALLIDALWNRYGRYDRDDVHRIGVVLGTLAFGPVLLVNCYLKALSGRPRPDQTWLFGGNLPFAPAGSFTGLCHSNCSFVSGEAAGSSWLLCVLFLLPSRLRNALLPITFVISATGTFMRVSFGRHFLSDALLGWLSTLVIFVGLCAIFGWPLSPKSRDGRK